jgi:diguanylate cyclase (GGDEF)-like protein
MRYFSVHNLTIGARLILINSLLAIAIVVVSLQAWRALDTQKAATVELSRFSQAQHYSQDADMYHDGLRADVYAAFMVGEGTRINGDEVLKSLAINGAALRANLQALIDLDLPAEIQQDIKATRAVADTYVTTAQRIGELAARDRPAAVAELTQFDEVFAAVLASMEAQTTHLKRKIIEAENNAKVAAVSAKIWIVSAGIAVNFCVALLVWFVSRSIRASLKRISDNASAMANGDLDVRNHIVNRDEVGLLAESINAMANNLQSMLSRMRADSERGTFGNQLVEALEMADTEPEAHHVIARAMSAISPDHPMELLLADSSRAHLERATAHPLAGAPGCAVESPFSCVAVRRGNPVVFSDSEALNACPRLRGRASGAVSAVCVPVSFMGRALGVLHSTSKVGQALAGDEVSKLTALGIQAGARIGTVRAFERTQVQASTDSLTGLSNRRTLEHQVRDLLSAHAPFALVMADLDRFKQLNDTQGHQAGDAALRQFAEAVRNVARETDLIARWGGEEFTFVLPQTNAEQALEWVGRLRAHLASVQAANGTIIFTASFGIADTTMGQGLEDLLRIADAALYRAKDSGRDCGIIGSPAVLASRHGVEHPAQVNLRLLANE